IRRYLSNHRGVRSKGQIKGSDQRVRTKGRNKGSEQRVGTKGRNKGSEQRVGSGGEPGEGGHAAGAVVAAVGVEAGGVGDRAEAAAVHVRNAEGGQAAPGQGEQVHVPVAGAGRGEGRGAARVGASEGREDLLADLVACRAGR